MRGGRRAEREQAEQGEERHVEVGETITMDGPSYLVRSPDGTVVTARSSITFTREGEYVVLDPADGSETTVRVTKPAVDDTVTG